MPRQDLVKTTSAAATVGLVPQLQTNGILGQIGTLGKLAIGAALTWFSMGNAGMAWAAAFGIGVGLLVDAVLDLTIGDAIPTTISA